MRAMCQLWETNFRVEERLGLVLAPPSGVEPLACTAARALVVARVCARAPSVGREYIAAIQVCVWFCVGVCACTPACFVLHTVRDCFATSAQAGVGSGVPFVVAASVEALASLVDGEVLPPNAAWRTVSDSGVVSGAGDWSPHACVAVAVAHLVGVLGRAGGSFVGGSLAVAALWRLMARSEADVVGAAAAAAACVDVSLLGFRFDIDDAKDAAAAASHDTACGSVSTVAVGAPPGAGASGARRRAAAVAAGDAAAYSAATVQNCRAVRPRLTISRACLRACV